ncbi:MAG TPA: ADP-dependent glucokinase/phosphofructokinase [Myxococcota bacterium]|jgi:ADP-dependent phosphofructokinase/glucokinase|nr:ADP-dependent glucokinase/phosphofructokinase [Myxococcota bacterium]
MNPHELKASWRSHYADVPARLAAMAGVPRVVAAFNANIDAVRKVSGPDLAALVSETGLSEADLRADGPRSVRKPADLVRGLVRCFAGGIAEEWLIEDPACFAWARERIGHDRMQMGGQAGIVANALAVCGVGDVLVHCASLPADQARLFVDRDNLRATDADGRLRRARDVARDDPPMIHWILEFDGGDTADLPGGTVRCPKSNRFIATYDPMNLRLHVDAGLARAAVANPCDLVVLSGYHLLTARLPDGGSGPDRVDASEQVVAAWRAASPGCRVHLEIASTQDRDVRRHVLDGIAGRVDSIGLNERETIDLVELLPDADGLAALCDREPHAAPLFRAIRRVFLHTGVPRLQLHMFGLYVTLLRKGVLPGPADNRLGMAVAAVVAAGKAGTGSIDRPENLLWAAGRDVSDRGLEELSRLAAELGDDRPDGFVATGIWEGPDFDVVAVPTILVERPVTLVGMGDTISSVSLVAACAGN